MEVALTDAAIAMFEVLISKAFWRTEAERDKQLLETATSATSTLDFFVGFGEAIAARRETGLSLDQAVNAVGGWEQLMQATSAAKAASRPRKEDDVIAYLRRGFRYHDNFSMVTFVPRCCTETICG